MTPLVDLVARYAPLGPVHGCGPLVAHQAADVFALWRAWEKDAGRQQAVPFWAIVWPAARVLARWVLGHPAAVAGRCVLDLGCGGAIVGIAAAAAGAARVLANDVDPAALVVAQQNAAANGVQMECSAEDLLAGRRRVEADVVLVADLFYEKEQAARAQRFLAAMRERSARVIIADAGRPFAPRSEVASGSGVKKAAVSDLTPGTVVARERVRVNEELEGVSEREVTILEMA